MDKYTLYLGLNDKDKKKAEELTKKDIYGVDKKTYQDKICNNILLHYTDGATIFEANGIYKHEDGDYTIEKTLRIELLFIDTEILDKIIADLKRAFNQEAIAVQKQKVDSYLV